MWLLVCFEILKLVIADFCWFVDSTIVFVYFVCFGWYWLLCMRGLGVVWFVVLLIASLFCVWVMICFVWCCICCFELFRLCLVTC